MKIKKSHLKELIRLSIAEAIWEQEDEEKPQPPLPDKEKEEKPQPPAPEKDEKPMTNIQDNPFDEKEVEEGGPGSGRPTKAGSKRDVEKRMDKAVSDANAKLDAAEKAMKAKKKKKRKRPKGGDVGGPAHPNVKESVSRRFTVKEVRMWMKKLEENRYKKVYNSDARRVAWMVNNEGVDLQEMPISMRKKWSKAQYGRERYLAKEFTKAQNVMEQKIRGVIKQIVAEEIRHTNARFLYVPKNQVKKVEKILKRGIQKGKVEVSPKPHSKEKGFHVVTVEKQKFNDIVEVLMTNKIKVKTIARGKA